MPTCAPSDGAQVGTVTYTLSGAREVGSFRADFNGSHVPTGGFQLQGLVGGVWTTLTTVPSVTGSISGSFTPTTVTALRYNVTGPGTGDRYIQNSETQVFLSTGQTIDHTEGYNIMRDVVNIGATTNSTTGGPWLFRSSANGGSAAADGDYFGGHVHSGSTTPTNRSFFTLSFTAPTDIFSGNLGWYSGQQWNNWEIYSSNAVSMPATQSLTAADPATIQAAGWRLEYAGSGFQQSDFFRFNNTGGFTHRHLFVVWNGPGALNEFELFVPEPASAMVLGFGGLMMMRRRRHR